MTGKIAVSILPDSLSGRADQKTIRFSQNIEVRQPDGSQKALPAPTWMFSFVQDADSSNAVAIAADNMGPGGTRRIAKAPQVFYPGRWTHEAAYDNRLDFDNGDFVRNTLKVVSKEWVETERGAFLAWKSEIDAAKAWRWAGSRALTGGHRNSERPCVSQRTPARRTVPVCASWRLSRESNVLPV